MLASQQVVCFQVCLSEEVLVSVASAIGVDVALQ